MYNSYGNDAALAAAGVGSVFLTLISLALVVVMIIGNVKIFQKAGKPGWHAIIPFLNTYDLFDLAWGNGILFLLLLIPVANFVVLIMLYLKLAKAFGKDSGFGVGLIFLPFIFLLILGFGDAQYIGPDGMPRTNSAYPQQPYPQQPYPQQPYPQQPYQAPQQPYQAPQQPYQQAPQQPYQQAPQQPYQQAPQQPYQAPQQPYQAPQQPYQAPQQQNPGNDRPQ